MTEPVTLSVRGTATLEVPPDEAVVHIEVRRLDRTRAFGFHRQSVGERGAAPDLSVSARGEPRVHTDRSQNGAPG